MTWIHSSARQGYWSCSENVSRRWLLWPRVSRKAPPIYSSYHSLNFSHYARILIMNACNAENGLCHNEQLLGAGRFSFGGLLRESGRLVIYRQVRESGRLRGNLGH